MKSKFIITGMRCAACASAIERAVSKTPGVTLASVNLTIEHMTVDHDPSLSPQSVIEAVKSAGYGAKPLTDRTAAAPYEAIFGFKRVLIMTVAAAILFISTMTEMLGAPLPFMKPVYERGLLWALVSMLLALVVMIAGHQFFSSGYRAIVKRSPNMDSLVAVGSSAAFVYSVVSTVRIGGGASHMESHLYYETVAVILALVSIGKFFEEKSKRRASEAVRKLIELSPFDAALIRDGTESRVPVESVVVGDILAVRAGERVPVDGVVTEGVATLDESLLTGESVPVERHAGERVIAGAVSATGYFTLRAERAAADSTPARLAKLVEEAQAQKAPIAAIADRVSAVFVPVVAALALLAAVAWAIAGADAAFVFTVFVAVLVIACPCAVGLATPTAIVVASGRAAAMGILIKSGEALEILSKVRVAALDKTGTITVGKPLVTGLFAADAEAKTEALALALAIEARSEHPLARAIVAYAEARDTPKPEARDFVTLTGYGARATINGSTGFVGALSRFLKETGSTLNEDMAEQTRPPLDRGETLVAVAKDGALLAVIALADTIKDDCKEAVTALTLMNIHSVMITGDHEQAAKIIAAQAGIESVLFEITPERKAEEVKKLKQIWGETLMAGDGINDAPALAVADVGVAVGSGADIAIESADVILVKNSLVDLVRAIKLSRATMRVVKQNLFWALAYNCLGIPVAMGVLHIFGGPLLNPMIAALAMAFSSVSVVANALRLKRVRL